jgi:ferredoxin-NADP reductase/ferredoxin
MYQIDLLTRDGASFGFSAIPSENLLDAAARAGHHLPAICRIGSCGSCRVSRSSGDVELHSCAETALPEAARAAGDILLCRAHALGDLKLTAPFDSRAVGATPVPTRHATLTRIEAAGAGAVRLLLQYEDDPDWGSGADFVPGQFAELTIPGTETSRAYSIASTPNWDGRLEFLVRLQPGGAFSSYLAERARVGDRIAVRGPQGSFLADEMSLAPRWFVAGGTGLAPMLSMLGQMAEFGSTARCRLIFGVNRAEELCAGARLAELAAALPGLEVTLCVWQPDAAWSGFRGTPADAVGELLAASPAAPDLYVCGPPRLIDAVSERVAQAGRGRLFSERFLAAAPPA